MNLDAVREVITDLSEEKRTYRTDWRSRKSFIRGRLGFLQGSLGAQWLEEEDEVAA